MNEWFNRTEEIGIRIFWHYPPYFPVCCNNEEEEAAAGGGGGGGERRLITKGMREGISANERDL